MGAGTVCALTLIVIVLLALGLALPIAEIVIGAKYLHDCPAEKYLPIYLIVLGVFSMVSGGSGGPKAVKSARDGEDDGASKTCGFICNSILLLFLFAWFICGNVWVFRMNECEGKPQADCFTKDMAFKNSTSYCEALVYDFVFYSTIVNWALVGLTFVIGAISACVICCK
ncbi:transmembrane protein 272-like [Watersipora subatra]|uniref:transmembrane protein 272-like n=1 Tax=Watersipora subatra TaxID=2589382 RepID=UPI00355BEBBA